MKIHNIIIPKETTEYHYVREDGKSKYAPPVLPCADEAYKQKLLRSSIIRYVEADLDVEKANVYVARHEADDRWSVVVIPGTATLVERRIP